MAVTGGLMMLGGLVGGIISANDKNIGGLTDACKSLQDAKSNWSQTQYNWKKLLQGEEDIIAKVKEWQENMASTRSALNEATLNYHQMYKKTQYTLIVGIIAFLFIIITLLFLKKINLWQKIKSLF